MGAVIGVIIGYALGTRAGEQGWTELSDAAKVIASSDEVKDLVAGGFTIGKELLTRAMALFDDTERPALRRVA